MSAVADSVPSSPTSVPIAERLLDAFPSGSYALAGLLRLMDVVETTTVPTAAVECRAQPRLLVNPQFVARYATTPEKLVVLIMHELHHVLLGHTTLFPRVTLVQNFVFDAVINGLVCRMFPDPQYSGFFTDFYRADAFPECLLRPPPGWPDSATLAPGIAELDEPHREQVAQVHRALYDEAGATYKEVFDTLPRLVSTRTLADIPLLGDHEDGDGSLEQQSPVLFDAVRSIVEQWPQPPEPIRGRSLGDVIDEGRVQVRRPPSVRAQLRRLIHKVANVGDTGSVRRATVGAMTIATPIPTLARRSLVQRALGMEPLLHPDEAPWRQRRRVGGRVHVYVDVSGSMDAIKAPLYGAVLDSHELLELPVHLFSTEIFDLGLDELRRGVVRSTGGTNIACVAEHMATHRVRHALIITDGWVGQPRGAHRDTLQRARIAVAYVGTNHNHDALAGVANHSVTLSIGDPS